MRRLLLLLLAATVPGSGCAPAPSPAVAASPAAGPATVTAEHAPLAPRADHHEHLMSDTVAARWSPSFLPTVPLPPALAQLLRARERAWNDSIALRALYTDSSIAYDSRPMEWAVGRDAVATNVATRYAREYTMTPFRYSLRDSAGFIAGYLTREGASGPAHFGYFHLTVERGRDGRWRIAAESPAFPAPQRLARFGAEELIAELDAAGIRHGVVMSLGYWWGQAGRLPDPAAMRRKVEEENDYTAREVAKFPGRLVGFCGVNPLSDYALDEMGRCARELGLRGLKLHFGNSRVDVKDARHLRRMQEVFREANRLRLPIAAHLWTSFGNYGADHATIFLEQILPHAPDVVVQVAHFVGGGPGYTDAALGALAEAVERGDPRTRNLYFDLATVAELQPRAVLETLARRIRQIGVERVLWGSDLTLPNGNLPAREQWRNFVMTVPLTAEEMAAIAGNVAPYLR